jgi:UDP-N-acetyl-D-glucosamine dehydrogenase
MVKTSETFDETLAKIRSRKAVVGVIGLGYVGLPLVVTCASRGYPTIGFDVDQKKVEQLDRNESYIDAVSSEALAAVAGTSRYTADFSLIAECDVVVICVPTPLTKYREPDLSYVEMTGRAVSENMSSGTLVVLESTTFPGTTSEVLQPILAQSNLTPNQDFWVAFSPEREDPGNAKYRTATIPKIVGADTPQARDLVAAFYGNVVDAVVPVSSSSAAEAVKITENVFRAVNIALVNELKVIFDAMGIDVWEVINGAATKPFGYMPFYPGPGLGGHCIPIDPFYLTWKAREYGHTTKFIELAGEINVNMPNYVVAKVREALDRSQGVGLRGARILLVGVSYKKNVPDMRESPSVKLLEMLEDQGASVDFLDPHVPEVPKMREYPHLFGRTAVEPGDVSSRNYQAILIATDHDAIDYGALAALEIPVVDTRNAFASRGLPMDLVTKA